MEVQTTMLDYRQSPRTGNVISKLYAHAQTFDNLFGSPIHLRTSNENDRFMRHGIDVEPLDREGPHHSTRYAIDLWPGYAGTERGLWTPRHRIHLVSSLAEVSIQAFDEEDAPRQLEVSSRTAAKKAIKLLMETTADYTEITYVQRKIADGAATQATLNRHGASTSGILGPTTIA